MAKDIMLGEDGDLLIRNGDFVIGDSLTQEVSRILKMNKGELKSDPLLGCNMIELINSEASQTSIETVVKLNLKRDRKNYNDVKKVLKLNVNG